MHHVGSWFSVIFVAFSHHVYGDIVFPSSSLSSSPPNYANEMLSTAEFPILNGDEIEEDNSNVTNATTIAPSTPVPPPAFSAGPWHFNYTSSNHFCILLEASSIDLQITYPTVSGNRSNITLKGPGNHTTAVSPISVCGANLSKEELNETLALNIEVAAEHTPYIPPYTVVVRFYFTRDPTVTGDKTMDKSQMYKIEVDYQYRPDVFVGIDPSLIGQTNMAQSNGTLREFVVLKDRSYQCKSPSSIKINDRVTISYTGLRSQAFLAQDYFSTPEPCPADAQSSDLIPIIIGAVLAAIVLIVLIAYLIGRARMRRSTYESI